MQIYFIDKSEISFRAKSKYKMQIGKSVKIKKWANYQNRRQLLAAKWYLTSPFCLDTTRISYGRHPYT